jgi:hypothetical protein
MEAVVPPFADTGSLQPISATGKSAASWPAIIAGAFVAGGASLILLALGSGLGFASVSPWSGQGVSATTFTVTTAIWLIVTQWVSAALGGYIAGRLRTRWVGTHTHEVFFRDTAHGLITWAVATVGVAALVGTSLFSLIGGAAHVASGAASPRAHGMMESATSTMTAYGTDKLFRSSRSTDGGGATADPRPEAAHIMANALATGGVPDADRSYLAERISTNTGISAPDAQKRIDHWISTAMAAETKAKEAADAARKAASRASIYTALALLVGAFIASVSAALGGRRRDEHP